MLFSWDILKSARSRFSHPLHPYYGSEVLESPHFQSEVFKITLCVYNWNWNSETGGSAALSDFCEVLQTSVILCRKPLLGLGKLTWVVGIRHHRTEVCVSVPNTHLVLSDWQSPGTDYQHSHKLSSKYQNLSPALQLWHFVLVSWMCPSVPIYVRWEQHYRAASDWTLSKSCSVE